MLFLIIVLDRKKYFEEFLTSKTIEGNGDQDSNENLQPADEFKDDKVGGNKESTGKEDMLVTASHEETGQNNQQEGQKEINNQDQQQIQMHNNMSEDENSYNLPAEIKNQPGIQLEVELTGDILIPVNHTDRAEGQTIEYEEDTESSETVMKNDIDDVDSLQSKQNDENAMTQEEPLERRGRSRQRKRDKIGSKDLGLDFLIHRILRSDL
ncbi:hypothetical protein K7X08_035177 [Anisodus acutangulus]|uniref:Uncharacterized protein n=1 Tax=Anisodus acutangulus TaxID=402998 RepID=A0A9Q1R245_9SOLA|nr:hypothetical protein K7X08_035177 [Anisodus acutangulus]